jgi:hypothetical protein
MRLGYFDLKNHHCRSKPQRSSTTPRFQTSLGFRLGLRESVLAFELADSVKLAEGPEENPP